MAWKTLNSLLLIWIVFAINAIIGVGGNGFLTNIWRALIWCSTYWICWKAKRRVDNYNWWSSPNIAALISSIISNMTIEKWSESGEICEPVRWEFCFVYIFRSFVCLPNVLLFVFYMLYLNLCELLAHYK